MRSTATSSFTFWRQNTVWTLLGPAFNESGYGTRYSGHSDGIVDTLSDMEEKAESSLSSTRKDEMEAAHAFAMLKQSLEGELKVSG